MRVDYPGLLIEPTPSGGTRYRVRVEGQKAKRIAIPCGPDDPAFGNHYWAARAGTIWTAPVKVEPMRRSLDWLVAGYLAQFDRWVAAGLKSASTLKQRRSLLTRMCEIKDDDGDRYGGSNMDAPTSAFVKARDAWSATPAEADNLIKAVRAMYAWAVERADIDHNPAAGVARIHRSHGGAVPWTAGELRQFRDHHPPGTVAHLWLTLQMFTACRIGDAMILGRKHEVTIDGIVFLRWQPGKRGSAPVVIPLLPPLLKATRAQTVVGETYLLTSNGRPWGNVDSLRTRVRRWCDDAGLTERSSHGIRKAVGNLLAEAGCTQHQIMAVMSHTQAQTSEIYTKDANRRSLARDAAEFLAAVDW